MASRGATGSSTRSTTRSIITTASAADDLARRAAPDPSDRKASQKRVNGRSAQKRKPRNRGFRAAGSEDRTRGFQLGKLTRAQRRRSVVGNPADGNAKNTQRRNRARSGAAPGVLAAEPSRVNSESNAR